MQTKQLTTPEDFETIIKEGVALVDFNAPWCGPCRAQEPIIRELSIQFNGKVTIAEMNIDENQQIAVNLGIKSIPTLTLFKNGQEVQRFVGLQATKTLADAIEDTLQ
jgi:thioredoxin 1